MTTIKSGHVVCVAMPTQPAFLGVVNGVGTSIAAVLPLFSPASILGPVVPISLAHLLPLPTKIAAEPCPSCDGDGEVELAGHPFGLTGDPWACMADCPHCRPKIRSCEAGPVDSADPYAEVPWEE